jgi:hypothetical protein
MEIENFFRFYDPIVDESKSNEVYCMHRISFESDCKWCELLSYSISIAKRKIHLN